MLSPVAAALRTRTPVEYSRYPTPGTLGTHMGIPHCSGLLNELEIPNGADLVRASLAGEVRDGVYARVPCTTLEYPLEYPLSIRIVL